MLYILRVAITTNEWQWLAYLQRVVSSDVNPCPCPCKSSPCLVLVLVGLVLVLVLAGPVLDKSYSLI